MPAEPLLDATELVQILNVLLESERAGARTLTAWRRDLPQTIDAGLIDAVARDEARYCAGLTKQIRRLGGSPSAVTGAFFDKAMTITAWSDRLKFLDRGQSWVARKIEETLPRIADAELTEFLAEMRDRHHENIRRCNAVDPG